MTTVQEQAMYKELGLQPYAVHTTFQFAGTEGKRHRLREAMLFYDPPDYYDVPGDTHAPLARRLFISLVAVLNL